MRLLRFAAAAISITLGAAAVVATYPDYVDTFLDVGSGTLKIVQTEGYCLAERVSPLHAGLVPNGAVIGGDTPVLDVPRLALVAPLAVCP